MVNSLSILAPALLKGAVITIQVTLISLGLGFLGGVLLAVVRVYGGKVPSFLAAMYSMVIRATPLLLTVLILFFVITGLVDLPAFWAGSLALAIGSSAYQSEIFRGAIQSVPSGQMLAARSMGMSRIQAIYHIILPQAIRNALAPWSNEAAIVLKDSSLVYVLGVPEILRQAQYFSARTYEPFLAFGSAAFLYFIMTFLVNRGLDRLEKNLEIPGLILESQ
ncbi:MAG: amino acid ABC transporter permease [Anaerolineales bacterium]|nr:amino acid ABC transporter permease [Anaerolineales bacterium]